MESYLSLTAKPSVYKLKFTGSHPDGNMGKRRAVSSKTDVLGKSIKDALKDVYHNLHASRTTLFHSPDTSHSYDSSNKALSTSLFKMMKLLGMKEEDICHTDSIIEQAKKVLLFVRENSESIKKFQHQRSVDAEFAYLLNLWDISELKTWLKKKVPCTGL